MLRKMFSLGALVVVAVTFGVGNAAANPGKPAKPANYGQSAGTDGFSDGRMNGGGDSEGFSDGRI
jgi:hypothetical protein